MKATKNKTLPIFEEKYGSGEIESALKILAEIIVRRYLDDQSKISDQDDKGGEAMKIIDDFG